VKQVILFTALHFLSSRKGLHYYSIGDSPSSFPLSELAALPSNTKLSDAFLASLVHFIRIAGISTTIFCVAGEKMRPGKKAANDNTLPVSLSKAN
jgi:hypothetical protein